MSPSPEGIDPQEFDRRVEAEVSRLVSTATEMSVALLAAAGRQIATRKGTPEFEAATTELQQLAAAFLSVEGLRSESAVFALARSGAAVAVALCRRLGIDPTELLNDTEMNVFIAQTLE